MTEEKLKELLNDQAFQDEMSNAATLEDAAKIMQQHGIQVTPEELQEIMTKMESESELNESELDDVAGGSYTYRILLMLFRRAGQLCRYLLDLCTGK